MIRNLFALCIFLVSFLSLNLVLAQGQQLCTDSQAIQVANNYLISKVGQDYFNMHYTPIGVDRLYNSYMPSVYYNYSLNGANYSIETLTNRTFHGAGIFFMNVIILNENCTAFQAAAVFNPIDNIISEQQAGNIATTNGYTVVNVTMDFLRERTNQGQGVDIMLTPIYRVATTSQCTDLLINVVNGTYSLGTSCVTEIPLQTNQPTKQASRIFYIGIIVIVIVTVVTVFILKKKHFKNI